MFTSLTTKLSRRLLLAGSFALATAGLAATVSAQFPITRAGITTPATPKCTTCGCDVARGTVCNDCAPKMMQPAMASSADMRAGSFVYTLDNDLQRNSIAVFRRGEDGSLTMLPGSPFNAAGKGLAGGDIDEQGAIRTAGPFVLAVNPGSDTIAVMRKSNAGLLHVDGSPFPSGGSTPLSLTVHKDLVYVANQAASFANPKSAPNITGFRLTDAGRLIPIAQSMQEFPVGAGPAQVEFNPQGTAVVVTAGFQVDGGEGSRLYSFRVNRDGTLTAATGSPVKPQGGTGTVGFSWHPSGARVYASVFKGSGVLTFAVDPISASLKQLGELDGDDQRAACWTAITRDGRTLYVGNFVSNSISVYDIDNTGALTLLGSVPRRGATNKDTKDIELSPDGRHLYAIGSGERQISVFRIEANRLLTELPRGQSPLMLPTGQNVTGLVVE